MTEHVDIADPEIHEPKGVAAAASGRAYIADGVGSGAWSAVWQKSEAVDLGYIQMGIVNNTATQGVVAATDATLYTDSDYQKWTTGWANSYGVAAGGSFSTDKIDIDATGVYLINIQATFQPTAATGAGEKIAMKFSSTNANTGLDGARDAIEINSATQICAGHLLQVRPLSVGDSVSLWFATENGTTLRVLDANVAVVRIG